MKTLILHQSFTGNTEKVTRKIERVLKAEKEAPEVIKVSEDSNVELYDYDLVFLGTPVIEFLPAKAVLAFIRSHLARHRKKGDIIPSSPKIPAKYAVCYCTYSGPHTGIREAIPAIKYMEQFFEHLRFSVLGEWYIVGEFRGNEVLSTQGTLGDIKGRPDENDLLNVETKVKNLLQKIKSVGENKYPSEFTPNALKFMSENTDFLGAFKKLKEIQGKTSSLEDGTKALIGIALSSAYKCRDCLKFHILEALERGMTEVEIKDALFAGGIIGGTPFFSFAFDVLKELDLIEN